MGTTTQPNDSEECITDVRDLDCGDRVRVKCPAVSLPSPLVVREVRENMGGVTVSAPGEETRRYDVVNRTVGESVWGDRDPETVIGQYVPDAGSASVYRTTEASE